MDPQKKIWIDQPGQKFQLKNNKQDNHYQSLFTPFVFNKACSLKRDKLEYEGTLMRFPLRTEQSELSDKIYDIKKLNSIIEALKNDASFLLLFLRHIEKIEVYRINTDSTISDLFSVEADVADTVKAEKATFFNQVKQFHSNPSTSLPPLQYKVTIKVKDIEKGNENHQWYVANWVDSKSKQILEKVKRLHSLPWLGLAASIDSQSPSRLFCFLPIPDSKEVNPPLPVSVHGTFGLTNNRRHLKWKTSDMQNDDGALWNDLLLSEMLPFCYEEFLKVLKHKFDFNTFYSFWPNVPVIKETHWETALKPLLSTLLHSKLFWSQDGSWVKLQPSVYVVPQMSSGQFPRVVINALISCDKVVVVLNDRVWKSVEYMYKVESPYPFTMITPSLVRQALKGKVGSYTNITREEKFDLLNYCLEDRNYDDLTELLLLPAVNREFVAFSNNLAQSRLYVCDKAFLQTKLLANNEAILVNVEAEDSNLHRKLIQVAESNCTQLQKFTTDAFAMILKQSSPFQDGWCCYGNAEGLFNENWLKTFWGYVQANGCQLSKFVGIRLLPVCYEKDRDSNGFKVVTLQNKSVSQVIKYNQLVNFSSGLINAAGKLDCYLTCSEKFQFLYHSELSNYVHDLTPVSLLTISSKASYQDAEFTSNEARALRRFIFQYSDKHVELNDSQKSVALKLKIFPALRHDNLFSLESAIYEIEGNSGTMILLDSTCLDRYTPYLLPDPLILTCTECKMENFKSMLPGCSWFPSKLEIILYIIIPAIESQQLTRESTLRITSTLLEENEYHSVLTTQLDKASCLTDRLKSLKFVLTSEESELCLPSQVYDPEDQNIKELFEDENAFPAEPFSEIHFTILRKLGMKTTSTLEASDIIRVVHSICNHTNLKAKLQKASNLIKFLCTIEGNTLLNTYDKNKEVLEETLQSIAWLPVMVNPPEDYPKCLEWKGATGSQFVSAEQIHASGSPDDHKKLPYLIGSQMKILQYKGILSDGLISSFKISQKTPLDLTIQQFLKLLYFKGDTYRDKCMELLYDHLQSVVSNDSDCEHWNLLRNSKVVQVSEENFVPPSMVACSFDETSRAVGKLEPYLYTLPDHFQQYRSLFCHIGVKKHITKDDVFSVLKQIASKQSFNDKALVIRILKWLISKFSSNELKQFHDRIFVPICSDAHNKLVLKPAKEVTFLNEDLHWLMKDKNELDNITKDCYVYLVHPSIISCNLASKLGLKPLTSMLANSEEFYFERQSEELTTRLNRILKEYKDTSVIQELLQNADDAKATEVAVYYDTRKHDDSNLFFPGMANSYGPALLFYNNAEFTEEDFENITKIAGETKMNKPLKIGKFGVGFCSVYHITDVPSFVSGEKFIIFDPTLQCLKKEIKSKINPGIKINFCKHRHLKKSQQLAPYNGIKGFDSEKHFEGTLFRFPLRSKGENSFTAEKVQLMFQRVKQNSSKLLMFLNNVKTISLYYSDGNSFKKDFEVTVTKQSVDGSKFSKLSTSAVYITQNGNREVVEEFLIASNFQVLRTHGKEKQATASVSIKVKNHDKANKTTIEIEKDIRGECFCYLPLHIETGLPVHVSSNFAVTTNHRGIWKADNTSTETDESNWNKRLMESVVVEAYIELLSQLQKMHQEKTLHNYTFSCLWPVDLKEINPWERLRNKFYESILESQYALFYSEITKSWGRLYECKFLSTKILAAEFNENLQSSLYHVADVLNLQVVKLPVEIQTICIGNDKRFNNDKRYTDRVISEEEFVKIFYDDKNLSKVTDMDAKSTIVAASLIVYVNQKHCSSMPELMKKTKCIPCSPDGKSFKKPQDVIGSDSRLAKLFTSENGMFPYDNFLKRNDILIQSLDQLGLMKSLSWYQIFDRAKHVPNWYKENSDDTLNRLIVLIDCIKENCNKGYKIEKHIEHELRKIVFLPVMKKPDNYPISWKGDSVANFLTGPELTAASVDKISAIFACGSQVPILDSNFKSYSFAPEVLNVLGIKQDIHVVHVINQFKELLQHFKEMSFPISKEVLEYTDTITITVYQYLSIKLKAGVLLLEGISSDLSAIAKEACVWNGKEYLLPSNVSFKWMLDGPYLYKLPDNLKEYNLLMKELQVKEEFSSEVLVKAIHDMKAEYGDCSLPSKCQNVLRLIIPKFENISVGSIKLYLPDEKFILKPVTKLRYNDAPWMPSEEEHLYCNKCISRNIAMRLGVKTIKNEVLENPIRRSFEEDFSEEDFGQEEKLTVRINNILRDYPRDITFLKEILQNADDAGASKLFIMLDKRHHSTQKVISKEWERLQGPALLFWNDSKLTDEDLKGIQKIGLGNKREHGIGFNVVYHYTDCPSFISNDRLCILDPHRRYIPQRRKPGVMYKDLKQLWNKFPHMKSSFLQNDLENFPGVDIESGLLFRLPLRLNEEDAEQSEIVHSSCYFEVEKLEKEIKEWVLSIQEALLFVHHVRDVRFFVIQAKPSDHEDHEVNFWTEWEESNPVVLHSHVESRRSKKVMKSDETNLVRCNVTLTNKRTNEEGKWLVQLGEGNPVDPSFNWKSIKSTDIEVRPRHGIAACLNKNIKGKPFCFLPLPSYTYLPVHIHGQFALHSDRQCVWISNSCDNVTITADDWNEHLIKAIGVSYFYFLTQSKPKSPKSLNDYYNLFPILSEILDKPWKTLGREVYKRLSDQNSQILATLVEDKNDSISWYNLHMSQASDEGYFHEFHDSHSDIWMVLKSIGMNLIDTPVDIHKQFKEAGIDLPIISKESVLKYYIRFQDDIYNQHELPCDVSSTRFSKVEHFVTFLKYLSIHTIKAAKSNGEQDTNTSIPKDTILTDEGIATAGLLITVDGCIHSLSNGKNIINSKYWHLFPNSKDIFLHEAMIMECLNSDSLFQVIKSSKEYNIIRPVFTNNLPSSISLCNQSQASLEDSDISLVKNMLTCIFNDPIFKDHQQRLLEDFALIPSDDNITFSSLSKVLPMIDDDRDSLNKNIRIKSVLRKLRVSFVNNDVLRTISNDIKTKLPNIKKPKDILNVVYLISEDCKESLTSLSDEELNTLFETFRSISYAPALKTLPIFTTIHGERTNLSSASKVWIWNDQICEVGIEKWKCHIQKSSVIFLDSHAPWALLKTQADHLDIKKISLFELYCDHIFPYFSDMDSSMRVQHIKFISKKMFVDCKRLSEPRFTKDFKELKCIGDDNSNLHNIGSFCDHTQEIFTVFCDEEQCFLPKELQDHDIQESLKFFGLRSIPAPTEFLDYCRRISYFTQNSKITKASEILLNILFQDNDQYKYLYNTKDFFKKVSHIPIAIIQPFPQLNAIAKSHPGDCSITCTDDTDICIELTKLCGSCIVEYKDFTWTSRSLVKLPSVSTKTETRAKALGISLVPSIKDVVENLINLANTEFAHLSRFHQCGYKSQESTTAEISCDLPNVVKNMLEYIKHNKNKNDDTHITLLQNVSFLPIKIQNLKEYALVKPTQVLTMSQSSLSQYYPFLHPLLSLEKSFQPMSQFLSEIGVKNSLGFSHIQLIFKLAKDWFKDEELTRKFDIKQAVAKATEKLIVLLKKAAERDGTKEGNINDLQELYLLNEQNVLKECSKLVVFDISGDPPALPSEFTYLNQLKGLCTLPPEELYGLLPQNLGLKSLKSDLHYKLFEPSQVQKPYACIRTIEEILTSDQFKIAIETYARKCTYDAQSLKTITEIITKFQGNLEVEYLADVILEPQLTIDNEDISFPEQLHQDFFLQCCGEGYKLSLKNTSEYYTSQVFEKMSKHLCSTLKLQKMKCFNSSNDVDVPELTSFVCKLLKCPSKSKLPDVLREYLPGVLREYLPGVSREYLPGVEHLPGYDNIEQELDMEPANPVLGKTIPECWHHRLDQSISKYFVPTEWIGYEIESERFVYAQILHISDITNTTPSKEHFLQKKYKITIGGSEHIETVVLKLFKLIHNLEEPLNESSLLRREEGANADPYQATIRDAVQAAWSIPEEERKITIKRLYLQYHYDKNVDSNDAANFRLLCKEIAGLEKSGSGWSGLFHKWNGIAITHKRYRSIDKPRESLWGIPKPRKRDDEAKLWIKQAKYDYVTVLELEKLSQTKKETCAATCFMSHEVAEKALKAVVYAKCGMCDAILKSHNLETPARALVQMGCSISIDDACFLENFYSHPRFPHYHSPSIVPGEKYLSSTATKAFNAAKKIYEVCKEAILHNEDDL